MIRRLFIVSASALVLALVCLGGAWAIGGRELIANGGWTFDTHGGESGPHDKRTVPFDPSTTLTILAPVDLEFTRGSPVAMTVSGPKRLMEAMRWEGGRLFLAKRERFGSGSLKVRITAPSLPRVVLQSAGNLELNGLQQPELAIEMEGAGNIEASGKIDRLVVSASGAGNVDLERLETSDADVDLAGFGNADISASGKVKASIAGAGNVTLHRKPAELHSSIAGLGNLDHDY